ncbi:MAG: ribonuclease HII [Simkaniaceae bacterium]|nr:ribonuclease HII [Simkaniaceae bacterium]
MDTWFEHESRARKNGFKNVAGVDEAGRGPLAGPVVAAACIVDGNYIDGINDSKKLTAERREDLFKKMTTNPSYHFGVGIVEAERIDEINILQATYEAMRLAVASLEPQPDYLLIDGNRSPQIEITTELLVKGDAKSHCIAAASVVAKHLRDQIMRSIDQEFPAYGFASHMGYGTKAHLEAIDREGPCRYHRQSFKPIALTNAQRSTII